MWILLLIVLTAGPPTVTLLQSYATLQDCENDRMRMTKYMNEIYPDESTRSILECKPTKKVHIQ